MTCATQLPLCNARVATLSETGSASGTGAAELPSQAPFAHSAVRPYLSRVRSNRPETPMAQIEIDRRAFIASLGGMAAVGLMSHEARADALEDYSIDRLD